MIKFDIIVAVDAKLGIGKGGNLPWHLPGDLKHFKAITTQAPKNKINAVIMGRKTWESIPEKFRPLSERLNVILTRNRSFVVPNGVLRGDTLEGVLSSLGSKEFENMIDSVFIIGGAQIFKEALVHPGCRNIHLTRIKQSFDCDVFFPVFENRFKVSSESSPLQENSIEYTFSVFVPR